MIVQPVRGLFLEKSNYLFYLGMVPCEISSIHLDMFTNIFIVKVLLRKPFI